MGCHNCSDEDKMEGIFYIVYTGGPPHAQFAAIQAVVTRAHHDGIVRRFQPTVHPNGSIEYKHDTQSPPAPEGYVNLAHNPWILHPVWPSCIFRMYRVQMLDDGQLKIEGVCTNPQSGVKLHEAVTCAKCSLCAVGCAVGSAPVLTDRTGA